MDGSTRDPGPPRAAAVLLLLVPVVAADALLPGTPRTEQLLLGVLETAAALLAGLACLRVGRSLGRLGVFPARRRSWHLLGAACLSWAAGQAAWTWQETVLSRHAPLPSPADAGYCGFAVLSVLAALAAHCGSGSWRLRLRTLADGLVMAGAVFCTAWVLVLGDLLPGAQRAGVPAASVLLALLYAATDVVLVTVLALGLLRSPRSRPARLLVAAALAMTAADTALAYAVSTGGFTTGGVADHAWLLAFGLFGAAALERHDDPRGHAVPARRSRAALLLPYAPLLLAAPAACWHLWNSVDRVVVVTSAVLVGLVLGRQGLLLAENHTLLQVTGRQREELQRMAHYDGLTGLANRVLFAERLRAAVDESVATGTPVTVAFVDLDDFKAVNDTLGHAAGDALLREVGSRLLLCCPRGGTAARLGGDEFAVVVADVHVGRDALARCIRASLDAPFGVGGAQLPLTASVGAVSEVVGAADEHTVDLLLALADARMYDAKRAADRSRALD
ncbi:hypothetical protein NUM3379_24590 [Kineococcus sp. NUM-3379]